MIEGNFWRQSDGLSSRLEILNDYMYSLEI